MSRRRLRARPGTLVAIDAVVAVVAMASSWAILSGSRANWPADTRDPDVLAAVLVVVVNATIALRRRAWARRWRSRSSPGSIYAARQYPPMASPAVPLIVYMAATRLDDRQSRLVLIVAAVASWVATTFAAGPTDPDAVLIVAGSWLLGHYVRTRRLLVAELEQRAADLEREREEQAGRAVAEERLRIARELHDVLAHTMSVVAVQAGTGRLVGADHPDAAIEALTAVETTARSAMHEMRQILTVLRADDDPAASVTPTPGLDDLPALVAQVTEAGIAVDVRVDGEPRPVPTGVGLAAYRITQEALTNVIKHAGARPRLGAASLHRRRRDWWRSATTGTPPPPPRSRRARSHRHARTSSRPRRRTDRRPRPPRRVRGQGPPARQAGIDVTIRVAIADDQPLVRAGFATMVSYADDLELVGEADNGADAVAVAKRARPDVFLMDIRMPGLDGLEATRRITSDPDLTGTRIIMLTTFDLDDYVHEALRNGASGFLLKDARPEDILNAVRVVAAGEALLAPSVTRRLIERFTTTPLRRPPAGRARPAHRTRIRSPRARRPRPVQRGDRRPALHQPVHGQDPRQPHPHQAPRPRPRPTRDARLRNRPRHPRHLTNAGAVPDPASSPRGREVPVRATTAMPG